MLSTNSVVVCRFASFQHVNGIKNIFNGYVLATGVTEATIQAVQAVQAVAVMATILPAMTAATVSH